MSGAKDGPYLGAILGHITAIANADNCSEIAEYCEKRHRFSVSIYQSDKNTEASFEGTSPYQVDTPERLSVVNVFLRHVEADNHLNIEGNVAVAFDCGESSSDELYNKLVDIFDKSYLSKLGLRFDPQKTSFVDMNTGKVPTQGELEKRIRQKDELAQRKFKEAVIEAKILNPNGVVNIERILIDYSKRKKAKSLSDGHKLSLNQESGRPMSSQNS